MERNSRLIGSFLVFGLVFAVAWTWGFPGETRLKKYAGQKLTTSTFSCRSDEIASAGFWRKELGDAIETGTMGGKQSATTIWKIAIRGNTAKVTRLSGSSQTIEDPATFSVTPTSGGIMLMAQNQLGESTEIISIDPDNASFVYSTHHVNLFWNRANIFWGTCSDG